MEIKTLDVQIEVITALMEDGLTIELGAKAITEPSVVDHFHYTITPTNGVTQPQGDFGKNEKTKIKTTTETTYTIKVTAIDKAGHELIEKTVTIATIKYTISLNKNSWTVTGGNSYTQDLQLIATTKAKEIVWTSNNTRVATVDQTGLVKSGQDGGSTQIVATIKGTTIKAECEILAENFSEIKSENTDYTDKNNNTATIPSGFAVGTSDNVNNISNGLVIQDNTGNQFVWIPCYLDDNGRKIGQERFANAPEYKMTDFGMYGWYTSFKTYAEAMNEDKGKSIKKYGGFYLGRFEVGKKVEEDVTSVVVKKYREIIVNKTYKQWLDIASSFEVSNSNDYFQLCDRYAWCSTLNFIELTESGFASSDGSYKNLIMTGTETDKHINLYGMRDGGLVYASGTVGSNSARGTVMVYGTYSSSGNSNHNRKAPGGVTVDQNYEPRDNTVGRIVFYMF